MIKLKEVTKIYSTKKTTIKALNNINIQFNNGEFIAYRSICVDSQSLSQAM